MIQAYPRRANLFIARAMCDFIEAEVLPNTGLNHELFWLGFGQIVKEFAPRNDALLKTRQYFQDKLDRWHQAHPSINLSTINSPDLLRYQGFLSDIGYLEDEVDDFQIAPDNIAPELLQTGAQLQVPGNDPNAIIQAVNARWNSVLTTLYHSDLINAEEHNKRNIEINAERMRKVVAYCQEFLDQVIPLATGSHRDATAYRVADGKLQVTLANGQCTPLCNHKQLVGFRPNAQCPNALLFRHQQMHIELHLDPEGFIGRQNQAHIEDLLLESVLSVIVDSEDATANTDVDDKIVLYRHRLALMRGDLQQRERIAAQIQTYKLNTDREFLAPNGGNVTMPGRARLILRNIGLHLTHPAILDEKRNAIPESILDAVVSAAMALLHRGDAASTDSIVLMIPKLHGSEEVAFVSELFQAIEQLLHLPNNTIKLGLTNDERRTSLNLKNCLHAARHRLGLISCDMTDRMADEISSCMHAGPIVAKPAMATQEWFTAYEADTVNQVLACGVNGRAQIGAGMWPYPERTLPSAGTVDIANAVWVPNARTATLFTLDFHRQQPLASSVPPVVSQGTRTQQLSIPLLDRGSITPMLIQAEIDHACLTVLAYCARWIVLGQGHSWIIDDNNSRQYCNRASLRLACQLLGNWLAHALCNIKQVENALVRMASPVDKQLAKQSGYRPMAKQPGSHLAFNAATALIFDAQNLPNGYTDVLLRSYRLRYKNGCKLEIQTA